MVLETYKLYRYAWCCLQHIQYYFSWLELCCRLKTDSISFSKSSWYAYWSCFSVPSEDHGLLLSLQACNLKYLVTVINPVTKLTWFAGAIFHHPSSEVFSKHVPSSSITILHDVFLTFFFLGSILLLGGDQLTHRAPACDPSTHNSGWCSLLCETITGESVTTTRTQPTDSNPHSIT